MLLVIALWSAFAVAMRALSTESVELSDAALIRFGVPALVLMLFRAWKWKTIRKLGVWRTVAIAAGAGLPHFALSGLGGSLSSAIAIGVIVPGLVPLWLGVIGLARRSKSSVVIWLGIGVTVAGISVVARDVMGNSPFSAIVLLAGASAMWAIYTAFSDSDVSPWELTAVIAIPNAVVALVINGVEWVTRGTAWNSELSAQGFTVLVVLGLGTGLASTWLYGYAIRGLGAEKASMWGSLSPVVTVVLAATFFDEAVSLPIVFGAIATVVGIAITATARSKTAGR